jgi:hypothetical protein
MMKHTKRFLTLFLAIALTLSFASCGASSRSPDESMDFPTGGDIIDDEQNGASSAPEASLPDEQPDEGQNGGYAENPFIATEENNVSTFSADVDTASYSYFRKLVSQGTTLENLKRLGTSFRTEEFLNYFKYNAATPAAGELFGVTADVISTPWNDESVLMRLTLQAEDAIAYEGNNLVYANYERHHTDVRATAKELFARAEKVIGDTPMRVSITGSGGMLLAMAPWTDYVVGIGIAVFACCGIAFLGLIALLRSSIQVKGL